MGLRAKSRCFLTTPTKEYSMSQTLLEMAKDLVMAQIEAHRLTPDEMHTVLQHTYTSLQALKTQEDAHRSVAGVTPETPPVPVHWKKSITKHTVVCLECGASFKQLSRRHLQVHKLDQRTYRAKYGIPRRQPLAAKTVTVQRKQLVQQKRPWEKAPTYLKAQARKAAAQARTTPTRRSRKRPPAAS